jgi:hypothetical protein
MLKDLRYALGIPAARPRSLRVGARAQPHVRSGAHLRRNHSANSHQIVDGIGEGEHPAHGVPPAIAELAGTFCSSRRSPPSVCASVD